MFHGGTCLRILYATSRFSEDLDFILRQARTGFEWALYLQKVLRDCAAEGIELEVQEKPDAGALRRAFLKTGPLGKMPALSLSSGEGGRLILIGPEPGHRREGAEQADPAERAQQINGQG